MQPYTFSETDNFATANYGKSKILILLRVTHSALCSLIINRIVYCVCRRTISKRYFRESIEFNVSYSSNGMLTILSPFWSKEIKQYLFTVYYCWGCEFFAEAFMVFELIART